jgi:hypothetical protein
VVRVDAAGALEELTGLSAEIRSAALLDEGGAVLAATAGADGERLARVAAELLDVAAVVDTERVVERVVVSLAGGAVFVVRRGSRAAVATTGPEPPAALVVHDLRACLERLGQAGERRTRARRPQAAPVDA